MTRIRDHERAEQAFRHAGYEFLSGRAPYTLADVEQAAVRMRDKVELILECLRALERERKG